VLCCGDLIPLGKNPLCLCWQVGQDVSTSGTGVAEPAQVDTRLFTPVPSAPPYSALPGALQICTIEVHVITAVGQAEMRDPM
jgi:hypothetical protein